MFSIQWKNSKLFTLGMQPRWHLMQRSWVWQPSSKFRSCIMVLHCFYYIPTLMNPIFLRKHSKLHNCWKIIVGDNKLLVQHNPQHFIHWALEKSLPDLSGIWLFLRQKTIPNTEISLNKTKIGHVWGYISAKNWY